MQFLKNLNSIDRSDERDVIHVNVYRMSLELDRDQPQSPLRVVPFWVQVLVAELHQGIHLA